MVANARNGLPTPKIERLAHIVRKILVARHWPTCRVRPRHGHALNFARRSLRAGHPHARIAFAYDKALRRRDQDAADCGVKWREDEVENGPRDDRWEPSSTVTLAARILATEFGMASVEQRRAAIVAAPREPAFAPPRPVKTAVNRRAAVPASAPQAELAAAMFSNPWLKIAAAKVLAAAPKSAFGFQRELERDFP